MRIGFIGGGQMCEGIVRGLLKSLPHSEIFISEAYEARCAYLRSTFPGARVTSSNADVINSSDVVVIAVKPQQLVSAFYGLKVTGNPLFISICAGVNLTRLEECILNSARIARVMPNLPAMVGEGASGFCLNGNCNESDAESVRTILGSVGAVVERVPEPLMDVVTGVSGSGPAFVCLLIEALADAGVQHGLPRDVAMKLAAQTCVGAGKLVLEYGDAGHPAVIKDKVCSPGGTSIAGVAALEQSGFRAAAMKAVTAAVEKGRELGKL
jgi:pyrroline-5-carboxylate reductase